MHSCNISHLSAALSFALDYSHVDIIYPLRLWNQRIIAKLGVPKRNPRFSVSLFYILIDKIFGSCRPQGSDTESILLYYGCHWNCQGDHSAFYSDANKISVNEKALPAHHDAVAE